jgi:hypothetical protein
MLLLWLLAFVVFVTVGLVLVIENTTIDHWISSTELSILFEVTEIGSSAPVGGAQIELQLATNWSRSEFSTEKRIVVTEDDGVAHIEHEWVCHGKRSRLGFIDTFECIPPSWLYQVVADGFEPSKQMRLDDQSNSKNVTRTGPEKTALTVRIALRRKQK